METKESLRERDERGIKESRERHEYFSNIFGRASTLKVYEYETPEEIKRMIYLSGLENFFKNIFGDSLFIRLKEKFGYGNKQTVKMDELTDILHKLNVVNSKEEGEKLIKENYGKLISCRKDNEDDVILKFTEVKNSFGEKAVRVEKRIIYNCGGTSLD